MNNQTPTTRRQLRERATPTEKDEGKKRAETVDKDKDTPVTSVGVKMRTRLSTGTLVMNGTSTVKEKDVRTPPPTPASDTSKAVKETPTAGVKRRATASGTSSEMHVAVAPKQRRIVRPEGEGSQNDYFCWLCHKEGCSVYCQLCPRSYHLKCLMLSSVPKDWVCVECEKSMRAECTDTCSKALKQINTDTLSLLLRYALDRMRQPGSEEFQKPVDAADVPMYSDFVFHPMDFTTLEKNIKKKEYGCTEAFLADAKWILHNCIVFNGVHHKLTAVARNVIKSCKHEMTEIEVCPQCYQHSCVSGDEKWFIEPCDPPHTLVWAKLKGYPFWPAKALQEVNGQVDVRFFGAHDMSWIPLSQVFLLSKETPTVMKNKKGGFALALSEMEEHIKIIKKRYGSFDYAPYRTPYDRRHVYMDNKLKCVNMMAAKRFKTGAFGKLARMKEAERVSAATKTASALKSKYNFMANKKSAAATGQGQGRQHQPHPAPSSSESSPEKAGKPSVMGVSSFQKMPVSKSLFMNPTVSVTDVIQEKIQKQLEEEGEAEEAGEEGEDRDKTAAQRGKDAEMDASRKESSEVAVEKRGGPEEVTGKTGVEEGKKGDEAKVEKEEKEIEVERKEGGEMAVTARGSRDEADADVEGELSSDSAEILTDDESSSDREDPVLEKALTGREGGATVVEKTGVEKIAKAAVTLKGVDTSAPVVTGAAKTETGAEKKMIDAEKSVTGVEKAAAGTQRSVQGVDKIVSGAEKPKIIVTGVEKAAAGAQRSVQGAEKIASGAEKPKAGVLQIMPEGRKTSTSESSVSKEPRPSEGSQVSEAKAVTPKAAVDSDNDGSKAPSLAKEHRLPGVVPSALPPTKFGSDSVAMERSPKSGVEYKDALLKTIEACKGKLGIKNVEEIADTMDISDDEDNLDIKAKGSGAEIQDDLRKDSKIVGEKAADIPKAGGDKVQTQDVSKVGQRKCQGDKGDSPKETSSSSPPSSDSTEVRQGKAGDSGNSVVSSPSGNRSTKTEAIPTVKERVATDCGDPPKACNEKGGTTLSPPTPQSLTSAYTSIKSIPAGKSSDREDARVISRSSKLVSELTKPLTKSPKPVSEPSVPVSASPAPVSKSSALVSLLGKDNSKQSVSGNSTSVVMVTNKTPSTKVTRVGPEVPKPGSVAVAPSPVSSASNQNSSMKPKPWTDSASSNSVTHKIKPITIDDDDEPGLLMEVESEAEHDSLIIDLDEEDLDLNESESQKSSTDESLRELAPSPAVMKNISKRQDDILRRNLSEPAKKANPSSTARSSPSLVTSSSPSVLSSLSTLSSSSSSSSMSASAPCVMIDVRSLSGTEHDWKEGSGTQPPQSQSQPQSNSARDPVMELPSPPPYVLHEFRVPAAPPAEPARRLSSSPSAPMSTSGSGSGSSLGQTERLSEEEQGLNVAAVNLVNKYSQQLVGNVQHQLAEMCKEILATAPKESENEERLQELREQLQWTHEQQMAEVQHNFKMTIAEMKACWEAEKSKALSDLKKKLQKEKEDAVADAKKKQWCASCWKEALYYCCWNTSYCSYTCQQRHWTVHQVDCRQAIDAMNAAAEATTASEATAVTTAVITKTAESDLKSMLGKSGTSSAEKDERIQAQKFNLVSPHTGQTIGLQAEDAWRNRLPLPPQAIGQNIHFLPQQQPPPAQPLQQLQYLHSLGPAAPATFQTNSQVQLLTQRPTLNTVLPTGAVMPGNTMVFPILRTSQPGTLPGTQNVVLNRSMHYQPMWKNC